MRQSRGLRIEPWTPGQPLDQRLRLAETTVKFVSQTDSDPFVVLKYTGRHYEWVKCSPEALVDICCHALVGTTAGGRGGGFRQIGSASETSDPKARPSRMMIDSASEACSQATRGGHTPRMVIDTICNWRLPRGLHAELSWVPSHG